MLQLYIHSSVSVGIILGTVTRQSTLGRQVGDEQFLMIPLLASSLKPA